MLNNVDEAAIATSEWILRQAHKAHADSLVVGISGGVDSAVVAGLCSRTGIQTVGVLMPCHSSPSSIARGEEVIKAFGLTRHSVNLEAAFDTIRYQVGVVRPGYEMVNDGALRSCLRAPTLDYVAKVRNGIVVGTGNRDEDEVTRYFQKRGDGSVDISPIAKYHKSEVYQLAVSLGVPVSVIKATPSADLWGPDSGQEDEKELGLTYDEVEWGIQFAQRNSRLPTTYTGGVTAAHFAEAIRHAAHLGIELTPRQSQVLAKLQWMEEKSRHKANPNLPVFDARAELGLDLEAAAV